MASVHFPQLRIVPRLVIVPLIAMAFFTPWLLMTAAGVAASVTAPTVLPYHTARVLPQNQLVVTNTNDGGPGSLRQAIADAAPGDSVSFDPVVTGVIILTSGQLEVTKDLTVSGPGSDLLAIDGNGASRIWNVAPSAVVKLSGLTVRHGSGADYTGGGGIRNSGTLTLTAISVLDNQQWGIGGGAIYNDGVIVIRDSLISQNYSGASGMGGGAIYNEGMIVIRDSVISQNRDYGQAGGIENRGTLTLTDSVLGNNYVETPLPASCSCGGGIHSLGRLFITNTIVTHNSALFEGGGIFVEAGTAIVDGSDVNANGSSYGGGVLILANAAMTITNSTIQSNSVGSCCSHYGPLAGSGGGVASYGWLSLSNVTVSANTAASTDSIYGDGVDTGAGIANSGHLSLNNVTISGNTAEAGGGVSSGGVATLQNTIIAGNHALNSPDCAGSLVSGGYNLIGNSQGCELSAAPGDHLNIDPLLFPLMGTPSVHLLQPGSPAIDAGDNAACPATDQRGVARPFDGNRDGIATCDIGAVEYNLILTPTHWLPFVAR